MNTYYLRTIKKDYKQMVKLGVLLGAITVVDGEVQALDGGYWDYIDPPLPGADGKPICDKDGNEYVHVNLLTPVNLLEAAEAIAKKQPTVAAGLSDLSRYFVVDGKGNAVAPANPHRVFAI